MKGRPRAIFWLVSICLCLFLVPSVWAESEAKKISPEARQKAEELFLKAEADYAEARYEEAIRGYNDAYLLSSEPLLLYNMAQCYRLLGEYDKSLWHYRAFLERDSSHSEFRALAQGFIVELEALRALPPPASAPTEEEGFRARRLFLPGGLFLGGALTGALALAHKNKTAGGLDAGARRMGIFLASASDLLFVSAGVSLFFSLRKRQVSISLSPSPSGGFAQASYTFGERISQ